MEKPIIEVEDLSKMYRLGEIGTGTISRDIERWIAKKRGKEDPFLKIGQINDRTIKSDNEFVYSLKDINFKVNSGDSIGIIGKNGAGKSTLLKILSRVTSPSNGSVKIKGRVASLLEVGTGFHPELTGMDNIFLNGAILGMRRNEIAKKMEEIIDFSGVERYIDTPVKRYSSGMYVRLAFAVAAHLESEVLIVDEVLAVGDADFQKKCLGKMGDISKNQGRTLLFVSHNLASVEHLCNRGIVLTNGQLSYDGDSKTAVKRYLNIEEKIRTTKNLYERNDRQGNGKVIFSQIIFSSPTFGVLGAVSSGDDIFVELHFDKFEIDAIKNYHVGITFNTESGIPVFSQNTRVTQSMLGELPSRGVISCFIEKFPLTAGKYYLDVNIKVDEEFSDYIVNAVGLSVTEGDYFGTGKFMNPKLGSCLVNGIWSLK